MRYSKIVISLVILNLSSCNWFIADKYATLTFQNNTEKTIFAQEIVYPDTFINFDKENMMVFDTGSNGFHGFDYPPTIENFREKCPTDTFSMFLFDKDTLNKYTWNFIQENNKYLELIILSSQEIENMDWTITYP